MDIPCFGPFCYQYSDCIITGSVTLYKFICFCCVVLHSREPYSASKYASDLVSYAFNIHFNSKVCLKFNLFFYPRLCFVTVGTGAVSAVIMETGRVY